VRLVSKKDDFEMPHNPYYVAPELLVKDSERTHCTDLWSCGVILYILLSGKPPFDGNDDLAVQKSISHGNFDTTRNKIHYYTLIDGPWKNISEDAKDLVHFMLQSKIKKRPSAEDCLSHPWFKNKEDENKNQMNVSEDIMNNMKKFKVII
jgi:calcium-dependent protein kinase